VVCGRYAEYICDSSDTDICSLECKTRQLARSQLPKPALSLQEFLAPGLMANVSHAPSPLELSALPLVRYSTVVHIQAAASDKRIRAVLLPLLQRVIATGQRLLVLVRSKAVGLAVEVQAKRYSAGLPDLRTALLVAGMPLPCQVSGQVGASSEGLASSASGHSGSRVSSTQSSRHSASLPVTVAGRGKCALAAERTE